MAANDSTGLGGEAGDVYVIAEGYLEAPPSVEYFSSAGVYVGRFEAPPEGFGNETGIAVDNDSLSPSVGDVYVAGFLANKREVIDEFSATGSYLGQLTETTGGSPFGELQAVAVDPSGNLWVYEQESIGENGIVDEFTDTGTFVKAFKTEHEAIGSGIAVDSSGDVYVTSFVPPFVLILKFDGATGAELAEFGEYPGTLNLAVDPSTQSLLVDTASDVALYGPNPGASSAPVERFPSTGLTGSSGIAVNGEDTVYAESGGSGDVIKVFDYVLFPAVSVEAASGVTQTAATLGGIVNPDEAEAKSPSEASLTGCRFEYGTEAGAFTNTAECSPAAASIVGEQHVGAHLSGLQGGTVYHYRLSATNAAGSTEYSQELELLTTGPRIAEESVSDVSSDAATLDALVNPNGAPTTYYFQYSTASTAGCTASPTSCTDVPAPPGAAIGSGSGAIEVGQQVQGLRPSTVYHYRVIAHNSFGGAGGTMIEGPDQTFATQGPGGTLRLPDGREWEMVSPAQKFGAQVLPAEHALIQASEAGGAISYYLSAPFVADPAGNVRRAPAVSRRGPDGWFTESIATPNATPSGVGQDEGEYRLFSSDLSLGLVAPFSETPLSPGATGGTPYLRDETTGVYTPLVDLADVPPVPEFAEHASVEVVAATPDLSHVVLFFEGSKGGRGEYEWSAGQLQSIPLGEIGYKGDLRRAISDDGSRIFGGGAMVDMTDGEVVSVGGEFQIASSDGSLAFFSSGGSLDAYDVETRKSTRVTVPLHGVDEFRGSVLGASEDGSYVYLVDGAVLSEAPNAEQAKAVAGEYNLYVLHREVNGSSEAWTPSFIATLSPGTANSQTQGEDIVTGDSPDWEPHGGWDTQTVEVSPNGQYLAFMSDRSLTGYDNHDASSGEPDEEVYRYDAEAGQLVCASCDPTGARPAGWLEPSGVSEILSDIARTWIGDESNPSRWIAATIPGVTEDFPFAQALYEPRYMLDNGRLFFDSRDALVPQAVNGSDDVYEYESGGQGSCPATNGGCVAVLSGGTGPEESAFVDASASGNDVFFVTAEKLVAQDVGNDYDMYDAHVCSTEAPCPAFVTPPPPCDTADSCKSPVSPAARCVRPFRQRELQRPRQPPPPTPLASKKTTKKTVKCSGGKIRDKRGKCVKAKKKKKKRKAMKSNRGAK